jgi:zinc protease
MKKITLITIICAAMILPAALALGANKVTKTVFPNGLTLIHQNTSNSDIVALDMFIKSGGTTEDPGEEGLAYLVQGVLYRGSGNRSVKQIAVQCDSMGALINKSCTSDYVSISSVVLKKYFYNFLDLFMDGILNPTLDRTEIERKRADQQAEMKGMDDSIYDVSFDLAKELLYGSHPYHKPAIGYPKVLAAINRNQILVFSRKFYRPENMILVVVGDIQQQDVAEVLKNYFPDLQQKSSAKPTIKNAPPSPARKQPIEMPMETKFKQGYLMMGYVVPSVNSRDFASLKVMAALLGKRNAQVFPAMIEGEGLAHEIRTSYPTMAFDSPFIIYLGTKEANLSKAQEMILKEIEIIKNSGIDSKELDYIKASLAGEYARDHQTNEGAAFYLGLYEALQKGYEYDARFFNDLESVSVSDLKRIAKTYFIPNNLAVVKLTPKTVK